ncbi:MAG: response regulator [Armatimonadota bacterium]
MEEMLTAKDVAELLQMHITTVYRLAEQGQLPGFKVGKQWRFRKSALLEWSSAQEPGRRPRVLVVDDEPGVLSLFAEALRPMKVQTTLAANAGEGLAASQQERFDVIFVDLKLPDMNGVELMKRLKTTQPASRMVVMTGYPNDPLVAEAARLEPVTILFKPFDVDAIIKAGNLQVGRPAGTAG